mmetsp:Transcript_22481/g.26505  ORF Transcript_22481/g.26505 Transcript_22481/m.26505 type:complete len:1065 (+) Transcript_22481:62-3256(+)
MGSNTSSIEKEEIIEEKVSAPEVALLISDLIRESEPPFKTENRANHSIVAIRALVFWDKFVDDVDSISLKVDGDNDTVWTQHIEGVLKGAVKTQMKLNSIRFFFSPTTTTATVDKRQISSTTTPRKRAISLPKPKKSKKRTNSTPIESNGGTANSTEPRERSSSIFSLFSSPSIQKNNPKIIEEIDDLPSLIEPMKSMDSEALLGGNFLHCAAMHGAVRLILWAVQEQSLIPLLAQRDSHGLTPLGVASNELAKLLKPLLIPSSLSSIQANRSLLQYNLSTTLSASSYENNENQSKKSSYSSHYWSRFNTNAQSQNGQTGQISNSIDQYNNSNALKSLNDDINILDRARKYHAIIQILRGCEGANIPTTSSQQTSRDHSGSSVSLTESISSSASTMGGRTKGGLHTVKDVDTNSTLDIVFTMADLVEDNLISGLALCIANGTPCSSESTAQFSGYGGNLSHLTWPNFMEDTKQQGRDSTSSSSSQAISPESSDPSEVDSCSSSSSHSDFNENEFDLDDDDDDIVKVRGLMNDPTASSSPSLSNQLKFQQEQQGEEDFPMISMKSPTIPLHVHTGGGGSSDVMLENVGDGGGGMSLEEEDNISPSTPHSTVSTISNQTSSPPQITYKTYRITDIACYFSFYKFIAQFEAKMTSDGHLALEGFQDQFYSPLMYEACGWALQTAKSFKLMVPMTSNGLTSIFKPLLLHSNTLQYFDCSSIGLSGKIPASLGSIPSLTYIDLHENHLTGSIPNGQIWSIHLFKSLRGINLSSNQLCGSIPSSLFKSNHIIKSLWYLNLHTNFLTDNIPLTLCQCTNLKELWLNHNSLKGEIPEAISNLCQLETLFLNNNDFYGKLPNGFSKLQNLKALYLQENRFTGSFPKCLLNLSNLKSLSLRGNLFDGRLPNQINSMSSIQRLHLGSNQFRGTIPKEFGELTELRHLYIDNNKLSGVVPTEALSKSPNIQTISLIGNPQLSNKGRATKRIVSMIYDNKLINKNMKENQSNVNDNYFKSPTSSPKTSSKTMKEEEGGGYNEEQDEATFVTMSKVNVSLLRINPLAPYSDDAENWRV